MLEINFCNYMLEINFCCFMSPDQLIKRIVKIIFLIFYLFFLQYLPTLNYISYAKILVPLQTNFCIYKFTSKKNLAVLTIIPNPGWYFYGPQKQSIGQPTQIIAWANQTQLPVYYPPTIAKQDPFLAKPIAIYSGSTSFFIPVPQKTASLNLILKMLFCSHTKCMPIQKNLSFTLTHSKPLPEKLLAIFKQSQAFTFKPDNPSNITNNTQPKLKLPQFKPTYVYPQLEVSGLLKAIVLGFFAGFILNFMPCVLPIIGLKLRALHLNSSFTPQQIRKQHLYFVFGILCYFLLLASFFAWTKLAWGEIFQNTTFILSMIFLIFSLSLSSFGLIHLPGLNFAQTAKRPELDSFLTGFLITLLATPCSGPLLGGVLAWSLTNNWLVIFVIFLSIGLGLAFPYLILACYPDLTRFMPSPGKWNLWLEKIIGFLLLATCIYLLSLLPEHYLLKTMICLLGLSFLLWLQSVFSMPKIIHSLILVAFVFFSFSWIKTLPNLKSIWEPYRPDAFLNALGQTNILIDFTANWCPTCKVLEHTVLTPIFLTELKKNYPIKLIKVDFSTPNPQGKKLLRLLNSNSIPILALFPQNKPLQPIIFRDIYTQNLIRQTLKKYTTNSKH